MSRFSDLFGGGGVPIGAIVQGQFGADPNYLPCDGSDQLRANYPFLDLTNLDTFGSNSFVSRALPRTGGNYVAYGNGLFVALIGGGTSYATSPDGVTWTSRTFPVTLPASNISIIYANGLFVTAYNDTATLYTSPDGITWTARTVTTTSIGWARIKYAGKLFFAFPQTGAYATTTFLTSPDGITWTARTSSANMPFNAAYLYGRYYVIHYGSNSGAAVSNMAASYDGVNWTGLSMVNTVTTSALTYNWQVLVTFANKLFIADNTQGYTSTDGANWTPATLPQAMQAAAVINNKLYLMPSSAGFGYAQIYSTPDLLNFTLLTSSLASKIGECSAYGNSVLVAGSTDSVTSVMTLATDTTKFRTPRMPAVNDGDRFYIRGK